MKKDNSQFNLWSKIKSVIKFLTSSKATIYYLYSLCIIVLFMIFSLVVTPEKYEIEIGQIAPKTIVATTNIVDTITTERNRADAARNVEPVYTSVDIDSEVLNKLDNIFDELGLVEKYGTSIKEGLEKPDEEIEFTEENISYAKSLIKSVELSEHQIQTLLNIDNEQFQTLKVNMSSAVRSTLKTSIKEGNVNQAKDYIIQLLGYKVDIDVLQNLAGPILDATIVPNIIIDTKATEDARQKAADSVEDVLYQKGQNIVLEGNRIYQNQYQMIKDLGLISDKSTDLLLYLVLFVYILISMLISAICISILRPRILKDNTLVATFLITMIFSAFFCAVTRMINIKFMPILLAPILLSVLIGSRVAIVGNLISALFNVLFLYGASGNSAGDAAYIIAGNFIAGIVVAWILHNSKARQSMLISGAIAGIINLAAMLFFYIFMDNRIEISVMSAFSCIIASFIAVLLAMALQVVCENIFNLTTRNKLLELSNTEHPLLRRMLMEAPGTYHHSMLVANLAEAAANSIGADSLLVKVGAYFHDIGKLYKPEYFTENQTDYNPHDKISPYESAEIVIGHVKIGLKMAKENRLPRQIREFIMTHHGDSVTLYFYNKALENANGEEVDINKFKYDGPKPYTKEQSILMLSDSVEAAVRSMSEHKQDDIEDEIERIIKLKIKEGQLSNSLLSIKDINDISKSFLNTLSGTYHERIKYPKIIIEEE